MRRLRLSRLADADVAAILHETLTAFGENQMRSYAILLQAVLDRIAQDPDRPSARLREDIGPDVRSFHVALAAGRRGAAAHLIYFMKLPNPDAGEDVAVLRILHERMEPRKRVLDSVDDSQDGESATADRQARA